jgi:hypothetical protein
MADRNEQKGRGKTKAVEDAEAETLITFKTSLQSQVVLKSDVP